MVNPGTPCQHGRTVKPSLAVVAMALALVACSGDGGREFATYYDPQGLFTTHLPAADTLTVTPPQTGGSGPGLLTGVIAQPPQPSPSPASGIGAFGSGLLAAGGSNDQTTYEAFAFTTSDFDDLDQMALYFLTGDPGVDLQHEDDIRLAGASGRLVVADVVRDGATTASVAAALTLGEGGTGYLVAAIFPPGTWDAERADFLRVVASFTPAVPPSIATFGGAVEAA
jgi:hypothetical protein